MSSPKVENARETTSERLYVNGFLFTIDLSIIFSCFFAIRKVDHLNGHTQFWYPDRDMNTEGKEIEERLSALNLSQQFTEPTNLTPAEKPSCIDLVIMDQTNLLPSSSSYCLL